MQKTVVEEVDLRSVALSDAIGWWNTAGLKDAGWNVVLNMAGSPNPAARITIVERHMNAFDLLNEICAQANLTWVLTDRVVSIRPRETTNDSPTAGPQPTATAP